ncbi:MAG: T9SS type A sorting domain-containing protein, partial [Flavobacteriales bacterium]|nr:T9SS type A sorting domain-containing protein [Flavobacteriales bacterium]
VTAAGCNTGGIINMYPNPAKGNLFVELSDIQDQLLIEIYNPAGQQVLAKKANGQSKIELDISGLSNGVYFVSFLSAGYRTTQKLSITH